MSEVSLDTALSGAFADPHAAGGRSLAATGFDALVIHAGCPPIQFLDDQDYPYKVNPHFKAWVPIVDNPQCVLIYVPGSRPQVLFHQPNDYWHKPASLPQEPWTAAVELMPMPDPAKAGAQWAKLGRVAFIGPSDCFAGGRSAVGEQSAICSRGCTTIGRSRPPTSSNACAGRARWAPAATWQRSRHFAAGRPNTRPICGIWRPAHSAKRRCPTTTSWPTTSTRRCCITSTSNAGAPESLRSFLIDAGAQYRGYASDITRTYAAAPGLYADLVERLDAAQLRAMRRDRRGPRLPRGAPVGAPHPGRRAARDRIDQAAGPGRPGAGRHQRVFPAWHRPSAGTAGARCGRRHGRFAGRRAQASGRPSVPAPDPHARARRGGDGGARHLSDRLAARAPRARTQRRGAHRLGGGRGASPVRRHPDRGQRGRRPRRVRRT